MSRVRQPIQLLVYAASFALLATLSATNSHAQRFEGIITFKMSGAPPGDRNAARGAGSGAAARPGEGRGQAAGRAGTPAPPAAVQRGDGARGAPGRSADIRLPSGRGDVQITPEQADAMRSAMAAGLQNVEYMTRRGRVRIAVGAPGGQVAAAMIYVPDDGIVFTLLPAVSMYSETALADFRPVPTDPATTTVPSAPAPRPPVVTHTKKFELVAGHKCEHVIVEYARQKTDICMGKGLGVFVMPTAMGRPEGWTKVMSDANGFPLKVTQANGTVTLEVTKIERKALAESLFNVPDTYTRMPDLLRRPPG